MNYNDQKRQHSSQIVRAWWNQLVNKPSYSWMSTNRLRLQVLHRVLAVSMLRDTMPSERYYHSQLARLVFKLGEQRPKHYTGYWHSYKGELGEDLKVWVGAEPQRRSVKFESHSRQYLGKQLAGLVEVLKAENISPF